MLLALGMRTAVLDAAEFATQKLAIVNVSYVFENYKKVSDLQRKIEEDFKTEESKLQQQFKELAQQNKDLDYVMKVEDMEKLTERDFDRVQTLRKQQYLFQQARQKYDAAMAQAYTKGMKDILTEIRVAIRTVADAGKFDLVLRSPDADDPATSADTNPADADKETFLTRTEPKTVEELTERFNRNPVLFGARPADITTQVLTKLNEEYMKRATGTKQ